MSPRHEALPAASAYDRIRGDVLARLEHEAIDPAVDITAVATAVDDAVDAWQRRAHVGQVLPLGDAEAMRGRVVASVTDLGPLTDLFERDDVEEVFIEDARVTFLDRTGRLQGLPVPTTAAENRQLVDRLLAATERQLDAKNPLVQARVLDGGARLTASQAPISDGLSATIRRHLLKRETLRGMVERDALSAPAAGYLWALLQARTSVLVSGPPGAGKTSMLAAMLGAVPSTQAIRCCEEVRELAVPLTHGAYYEARPAALDGSGAVTLRDLVKFTLAMRPDRIVVGEVRGAEAFELTRAVNAGCGFACTVHANTARDALTALVNAAIMAGENVHDGIVRRVFSAALDVVVHVDRDQVARRDQQAGGIRRQVTQVEEVLPALTDDFTTEPIFARSAIGSPMEWTGTVPAHADRVDRALPDGLTLRAVLEGRVSPL